MQMDYEWLSKTPLFAGASPGQVEELLVCLGAARRSYGKGELLLRQGEPTDSFGLVLSGRVLLSSGDCWGGQALLGSLEPGEVFAESYACTGRPLWVQVQAAEPTQALFLRADRAARVCPKACPSHSLLVQNLLSLCAQKNLALSRKIAHTTPKTIRGRLCSYLSDQALAAGSRSFTIPYNRQQLADYLHVDRSALSNELSQMRREGLLRVHRSWFSLLGKLDGGDVFLR